METSPITEKIELLKAHLPWGAINDLAEKEGVHRSTVWRAVKSWDTSSTYLQTLLQMAADQVQARVKAEQSAAEIAQLSAELKVLNPSA